MITLTFAGWMIPLFITVIACGWAIFVVDGGTGYGAGIANIFALVPALFVSMVSWIIYAILI